MSDSQQAFGFPNTIVSAKVGTLILFHLNYPASDGRCPTSDKKVPKHGGDVFLPGLWHSPPLGPIGYHKPQFIIGKQLWNIFTVGALQQGAAHGAPG